MWEKDFPAKLWELVNREGSGISWVKSGTAIVVDFEELDGYLQSSESIFSMKNQTDFVLCLFKWGFRRAQGMKSREKSEEDEEIPEVYCNEFFKRSNSKLLDRIKPMELKKKNWKIFLKEDYISDLRERDPCYRVVRKLPRMESELNHLITVVEFEAKRQNPNNYLEKKNPLNFLVTNSSCAEEPNREVSTKKTINAGDIAGFYGTEDTEKLTSFFGSYMPTYEISETFSTFAPQATSSKIWETPLVEDEHTEVPEIVPEPTDQSAAEEILPEDGQSPIFMENKDAATPEVPETKHAANFDISLQLQASFDVLYNNS